MSKINFFKNKVETTVLSTRIRKEIHDFLKYFCKNTGINQRFFLELAIIESFLKMDTNFNYEGIDFKEYFKVLKLERLRIYQGKLRQEHLSKSLFLNRVRLDLLKLISCHSSKKDIEKYLGIREKEIEYYTDNEDLKKQFKDYLERALIKPKELKKELMTDLEKNGDKVTPDTIEHIRTDVSLEEP